jgi:serine protease inhibitor
MSEKGRSETRSRLSSAISGQMRQTPMNLSSAMQSCRKFPKRYAMEIHGILSLQEAAMSKSNRVSAMGTAISALLAATAALGPSSNANGSLPRTVVEAKEAGTAVDRRIVASNNAFGLNLFKRLVLGNPDNVAISPLSVALALQIVYNGVAGTTQPTMMKTLQRGGLTAQEINNANAALQASLINPDPQVHLTIANSLWMHLSHNPVLPSFTQTNMTYYSSTVGDLSGAPTSVNAWVARETNDLITEILPPQPAGYYASVAAIIANAIYFKGQWSRPFDTNSTASAPFTLSNGDQVPCEMMHQRGNYEYLKGSNFQAIRLPYGQGRLSMLIVLPNTGVSLSGFIADITATTLESWIAQFKQSYGTVALPRDMAHRCRPRSPRWVWEWRSLNGRIFPGLPRRLTYPRLRTRRS